MIKLFYMNTHVIGVTVTILSCAIGLYFLQTKINISNYLISPYKIEQKKEVSKDIFTDNIIYYKNVKGFYAAPKKSGEYPGIVMIHEWWGLDEHSRKMAQNLAKEGYKVLVVDLYGKLVKTPSEARQLSTNINQEEANRNMIAALKYLKNHDTTKIASLGWCFGGRQALQLAVSGQSLDATVIYYGIPIMDPKKLSNIKWPLLAIYGDNDDPIPLSTVKEFENVLIKKNIEHTFVIYPGLGHAFANPNADTYSPKETKDAWKKVLKFLNTHLK